MTHWRIFNYSASLAVTVTALAVFAEESGGDFLLLPGAIASVFLDVFFLVITDDTYVSPWNSSVLFNVAFYSVAAYGFLWAYKLIRYGYGR